MIRTKFGGEVRCVTGRIGPESVNPDKSVALGKDQMETYEASWPQCFHDSLHKEVVTMSAKKNHVKVGKTDVYATNLISARVMVSQQSRENIGLKNVLEYEFFSSSSIHI